VSEDKPASAIAPGDVGILVEIALESGRFRGREGGRKEGLVMIRNWRI
jgi:hypothetical protein